VKCKLSWALHTRKMWETKKGIDKSDGKTSCESVTYKMKKGVGGSSRQF
jgi:hypothetical protein